MDVGTCEHWVADSPPGLSVRADPGLPRCVAPPWRALAIHGIAAAALLVALIVGIAPRLPFGLDRCSGPVLGLIVAAGLTGLAYPELALPLVIIGAGLIDSQLGGDRVRHLVFVKLALFACAGLGIIASTLRGKGRFVRARTPADLPALLLLGYTALSAAWGILVAGHDAYSVAIAGYQLSQLALYHFLVTTTLSRPHSFRQAGIIVIGWSLLWVVPSLLTPGRGGGTATTWLIVFICYAMAPRSRWATVAWAALPIALLDTLTCGYRTLWVSVAGQLSWLAGIGFSAQPRRLRSLALALLILCALGAALAVARPSLLAPLPAADTLSRFASSLTDGGYRLPEALIGLAAFRENPLFGRSVGYHTSPVWVQTMGYMPVGPIYHVFYVGYLANEGLIGLGLVLWYFAAVLLSRDAVATRRRASADRWAAVGVGLQAALFGAILGAFLSGPTDGHWTWGVFGAAALLPAATRVFATRGCEGCPARDRQMGQTPPHAAHLPSVRASCGNA